MSSSKQKTSSNDDYVMIDHVSLDDVMWISDTCDLTEVGMFHIDGQLFKTERIPMMFSSPSERIKAINNAKAHFGADVYGRPVVYSNLPF